MTNGMGGGSGGGPGGGLGGNGLPGGFPGGGDVTSTRGVFAGADQLIGTVTASFGWQTVVIAGVGILLIAAIGALIPALLTAKVRPIEVLRGE